MAVQERHGRRYAAQHWPGMPVVAYVDNDLSAADPTVTRPEYHRMLDAIRAGRVAAVVTREQARLTRQPSEWEDLCVTLTRAGLDVVHTTTAGTISVTKGSRLAGRIMAVVDAEEAERASVRVRIAMEALAEEGRPSGSTAYGYRRALDEHGRKTLVPDPDTAPVVRRIIDRLAAGASLGAVAAELTADGIPTPRGAPVWHRETIRTIATSPRIIGRRVHRGVIVGPAQWPAIVDETQWKLAMDRLSGGVVTAVDGRVRVVQRRRSGVRRYLLTGIAVCGECGTPLIAARQARRHGGAVPAYSCPHPTRPGGGCGRVHATAEHVDAEVVARLHARVASGGFPDVDDDPEVGEWQRRLAAAEERLATLATRWGAGEITEIEWRAARATAADEATEARRRLAALDQPRRFDRPLGDVAAAWGDLELADRRDLLAMVTQRIAVDARGRQGPRWDPTRVRIEWRA